MCMAVRLVGHPTGSLPGIAQTRAVLRPLRLCCAVRYCPGRPLPFAALLRGAVLQCGAVCDASHRRCCVVGICAHVRGALCCRAVVSRWCFFPLSDLPPLRLHIAMRNMAGIPGFSNRPRGVGTELKPRAWRGKFYGPWLFSKAEARASNPPSPGRGGLISPRGNKTRTKPRKKMWTKRGFLPRVVACFA